MRDRFDHLTGPQVALLLGAMACAVAAAVLVPAEKWAVIPWESVLAIVAAGGVGTGAALMRPRPEAERRSTSTPPRREP